MYIKKGLLRHAIVIWFVFAGLLSVSPARARSQQPVGPKSPGTALVLSLVLPGAGQVYNGQFRKAGLMLAATAAGVVVWHRGLQDCSATLQGTGYVDQYGRGVATCEDGGQIALGALTVTGTWIWSMIDANRSAKKINRGTQRTATLEFGLGMVRLSPPNGERIRGSGVARARARSGIGLQVASVHF